MKRFLSVFLVICLLMTLVPNMSSAANLMDGRSVNSTDAIPTPLPNNPFSDVEQSDWFYDSVMYVIEHDIFNGTGDNAFSPYGTMTRGMYVTVMGRIAGVDISKYTGEGSFADVDQNAYYAPYVAWAVENGITKGVGAERFQPNGILNREQMAVFTLRYFVAAGIEYDDSVNPTTPKDLSTVSDWAKDAVLILWKAGLLKGDENGHINPQSNANRAESAAFCARTNEVVEIFTGETIRPTPSPTPSPSPKPQSSTQYVVSFNSNGGSNVDNMYINRGGTLPNLPTPQKANAVFLGWYQDAGFQGEKFTLSNIINYNTTLYAKYMAIEATESLDLNDTFTLSDQAQNLTINITSSNVNLTADQVKSGITLDILDGSEAITLVVTGSNGTYVLSAADGYTAGSSYQITLTNDALGYAGQENNIRKCALTIEREESFDVAFNDGIVYIPVAQVNNMVKNGVSVPSLSVPLFEMSQVDEPEDGQTTGTFTYLGAETLEIGDELCVYSGATKPVAGNDAAFLDADIAYITVTNVNGNTITYKDAAPEEIIFLPDVLPVFVGAGHTLDSLNIGDTTGSFTESMTSLNFARYADMGLSADTIVDVGDYLALHEVALDIAEEDDVVYAEVTSVSMNGDVVTVDFTRTSADAMQNSTGYNSNNEIDGDTLLEGVDVAEVQQEIEQQMIDSGFANDAAVYFAALATTTEGFQEVVGSDADLLAKAAILPNLSDDGKNSVMSGASLAGASVEDMVVKATISKNTKKLSSGVRCAVEVSFKVPIDTGDNNAVEIAVKATFVEELKMSVNASGDTIWKKKWIFPYISDYKMTSKVDVYNFTGISFQSTISSRADTNTIDISEEMQKIIASTNTANITAGVQDLFELYGEMMENETDWISIIDKEIVENNIGLLMGVIQIKISANFVVSANINVALGCNFEYTSGKRYCFWAQLKAKEADSETIDLTDETYGFQFYCLGMLGLRAGILLEVAVGLFSTDLNSVGLTAEAGVYTKVYGYFFYELKSVNNVKTEKKTGALYFELGIYLEIAFKAQVLKGKFQYNPTLFEKEWPLLTAGKRYNVYDFAYDSTNIQLKDTVRSYTLPDSAFQMTYLDLREGDISTKSYETTDFTITFTDNRFSMDGNKIVVNVPANTHMLSCDMTIVWKTSALALSSVPISRTYHIVWDDLSTNGYTISFNSNGGSAVSSITKLYGAAVSAPTAPTKTGYNFAGWYADEALTTAYTFSTMGWNNITLYAKWTAKTNTPYKVRHYQQDVNNSNNYSLVETQSLTGTTGTNVTPAVRSYAGFTAPVAQTVSISADGSQVVSYYYTRNTYTLTFIPGNGDDNIVKNLKFGAAVTAPTITKRGYAFSGWSATVATTMPASNLTYTALWTVNTYAISFDANGGSACQNITVTFGGAYGELPVTTKDGYIFDGWYSGEVDDVGAGSLITAQSVVDITGSQVLYARWTVNNDVAYTVRHYQQNITNDDYTLFETINGTGTAGAQVTPAVRNDAGFTAPSTTTAAISANGSTVIDYYYTRNAYTLTFDDNGGDGGMSSSVKYDAVISAPTVTKEGFIFGGWSPQVAANMPASDTTYVAQWLSSASVSNLADLQIALANNAVSEVVVTQAIALPNGTTLDGLGKMVRVQTTGVNDSGNVQNGSAYSVFTVAAGSTVTIANLTVKGGSTSAIVNGGSLTMNRVIITQSGSSGNNGGGFRNTGKALLKDCSITMNVANAGGGFINSGGASMILDGCSVTNNRIIGMYGGGGCENSGSLYLLNTTFANNQSLEIGGAINNYTGTVYIVNSTITANLSTSNMGSPTGGGIGNNGGTIRVVNSLLANNFEKHGANEAKPSDIGVYSSGNNIYLYNSYCGAFVTSVAANLAVTGDATNNVGSVVNPIGNGLTDIFSSYADWNGLSCPTLLSLANNTSAAPLAGASAALNGGTDVYFEYTVNAVTALAYGIIPEYLVGTAGGTKMTVYQDGSNRTEGVIGAYGAQ